MNDDKYLENETYAHLKDTWYLTTSDVIDSDREIKPSVEEDGCQLEIAWSP